MKTWKESSQELNKWRLLCHTALPGIKTDINMQPKHKRKLVFSSVALTRGSVEHDWKVREGLRDELEAVMLSSHYLDNAPFLWVGIIFLYGLKNEITPHYQRIHKKHGDLPLKLELDMRVLLTADETDPTLLKEFFEIAALDCLIHAGRKYKLNIEGLLKRRSQLGKIPEWEPEMDDQPELLFDRYKASLSLIH